MNPAGLQSSVTIEKTYGARRKLKPVIAGSLLWFFSLAFAPSSVDPSFADENPNTELAQQLVETGRAATCAEVIDLLVDDFFSAALARDGTLIRFQQKTLTFRVAITNLLGQPEDLNKPQAGLPDDIMQRLTKLAASIGIDVKPADAHADILIQPFKAWGPYGKQMDEQRPNMHRWRGYRDRFRTYYYAYQNFCGSDRSSPEIPQEVDVDGTSHRFMSWNAHFCEARPSGGIALEHGNYLQAQCEIMLTDSAKLIEAQVSECLLRSFGLLGASNEFRHTLLGRRPPEDIEYYFRGRRTMPRAEYHAQIPYRLADADRLYLRVLYSGGLHHGMTRAQAEEGVRNNITAHVQCSPPKGENG